MKVLVCGGRDFDNARHIYGVLNKLHRKIKIVEIIHGGATGADSIAGSWARHKQLLETCVPADWCKHGRAAGPIRNKQMLDLNPDLVVAFLGGIGTDNMIRQAKRKGVPVIQPPYFGPNKNKVRGWSK